MKKGFTDLPAMSIEEDLFEINKYIDGLSEFILECDTPMTIAIQGDWGSGKTSFMNMIRCQIESKVVTSWFNTWQYSQFNMGDTLSLSLIKRLIDTLPSQDETTKRAVAKTLNLVGKYMKEGALMAVDMTISGRLADNLGKAIDGVTNKEEEIDLSAALGQLKQQFQECINNAITNNNEDRVVIFVDDLDRLTPAKAVEMLEVLKLFLDCENCVFILAIDYQVVSQGIAEKYQNKLDDEKGKAFFDKIIQVPFKMPVALYNMDKFIQDILEQMGLELNDTTRGSVIDYYKKLISCSIGSNPRGIKRLFNAYLLLKKIYGTQAELDQTGQTILFAILCMQLSFENLYNHVVKNKDDIRDDDFLKELTKTEAYRKNENDDSLMKELRIKDEDELRRICTFMDVFYSGIDYDSSGDLSEEEKKRFINLLELSSIVSTKDIANQRDDFKMKVRGDNRLILKNSFFVKPKRKRDPICKVYQSRKDYEDWSMQDASAYYTQWSDKSKIWYKIEVQLVSDLEAKQTEIKMLIQLNNHNSEMNQEVYQNYLNWLKDNTFDEHCKDEKNTSYLKTISWFEIDQHEEIKDVVNNEAKMLFDQFIGI